MLKGLSYLGAAAEIWIHIYKRGSILKRTPLQCCYVRENQRPSEGRGEVLQRTAEAPAYPDLASQQSDAEGIQRSGSQLDFGFTLELPHFLLCTLRVRFFNRLLDFRLTFRVDRESD